MADRAVVNASPLIFLAKAELLDLLLVEAPEIVVPMPVRSEVVAKTDAAPLTRSLAAAAFLRQVEAPPVPELVSGWDLGPGESAVLAWAMAHPGSSVILDDLPARRCALAQKLELTGTLGLVLRAHRRGVIRDPRATIERLRSFGMWLSDSVVERALALAADCH